MWCRLLCKYFHDEEKSILCVMWVRNALNKRNYKYSIETHLINNVTTALSAGKSSSSMLLVRMIICPIIANSFISVRSVHHAIILRLAIQGVINNEQCCAGSAAYYSHPIVPLQKSMLSCGTSTHSFFFESAHQRSLLTPVSKKLLNEIILCDVYMSWNKERFRMNGKKFLKLR